MPREAVRDGRFCQAERGWEEEREKWLLQARCPSQRKAGVLSGREIARRPPGAVSLVLPWKFRTDWLTACPRERLQLQGHGLKPLSRESNG